MHVTGDMWSITCARYLHCCHLTISLCDTCARAWLHSKICRRWEVELDDGKDHFRSVTGLPISTYFSAYKFQWLHENVPEVRARVCLLCVWTGGLVAAAALARGGAMVMSAGLSC